MRQYFDWIALVNFAGVVIGLFFVIIIFGIKKTEKATRLFLSAVILIISILTLVTLLNRIQFYSVFPHLMGLFPQFYLALGPLLFLYVKALTTSVFSFKKIYWLHFIPLGINFVCWIPFYFKGGEEKLYLYTNNLIISPLLSLIIGILYAVQLSIYLVMTSRLLKKHYSKSKDSFSAVEKIKLGWIRHLIWGLFSLICLYLLWDIKHYYCPPILVYTKKLVFIWNPLLVFFLGFKGLTQPEIFSGGENKNNKKYSHSTLSKTQAEEYLNTLQDYMEREKPYLDGELTITSLSEKLSIPSRYISQVINERLNQNFFDFVNQYRVKEAKKLLLQEQTQQNSILDIAYDSGFNSKSSFNFVFKKYSRMTPSQFRQHNLESRKN
jgi:AraC-like DNA-binding protein